MVGLMFTTRFIKPSSKTIKKGESKEQEKSSLQATIEKKLFKKGRAIKILMARPFACLLAFRRMLTEMYDID